MRWLYFDPHDRREAAQHEAVLAKIDAWWYAFQSGVPQLEAQFQRPTDWDLAAWMQRHLQTIHPELMWEFGRAIHGPGYRLVITPESERWLRPLVATLLERAPQLPGWEFYRYRLPESVADTLETIEARVEFDLAAATVEAHVGQCGRIDLCYYLPELHPENNEVAQGAAFVATETLLGEEMLDRWIGCIDVARLKHKGQSRGECRLLSLDRVQPTVAALVGSQIEQLPAEPTARLIEASEWSGFELHPEEQDDYAGRDDLYFGISGRPDVFEAAHNGGVFDSACHSRCGETFCYLKIDGENGLEGSCFSDRAEIEEALQKELIAADVGCCFGGGTGARYSYIDLALTDIRKAVAHIRHILLDSGIPRRTWLQFFDDTLSHEWIGIFPDAPRPPM
jgi:hypothetical protein